MVYPILRKFGIACIISNIATCKISLTLKYFKDHIYMIWVSKLEEVTIIMNMKFKHNCTFV